MKHVFLNRSWLVNKLFEGLARTHLNGSFGIGNSKVNACLGIVHVEVEQLVFWKRILRGLHQISVLDGRVGSNKLSDV